MPRRNRPRRDTPRGNPGRALDRGVRTEAYAGQRWMVRPLVGNDQGRSYICPGCQVSLPSSIAHVVVWPAEGLGDVTDRRHWHTPCWTARDRRPPRGSWR